MNEDLRQAIDAFRQDTPEAKDWTDREVLEAMLLILSTEPESGVKHVGRGDDGNPMFAFQEPG